MEASTTGIEVRARSRVAIAAFALCCLIVVASILHARPFGLGGEGLDPLFNSWLYNTVTILCALGCLARGILVRGDRWAWLAAGVALSLSAAGDLYWTLALADDAQIAYPSLADAFWLASYPPLYLALVLFIHSRLERPAPAMVLDGAIAAATMVGLALALLGPAFAQLTEGDSSTVITNMAYPLADIALLSLVMSGASVVKSRDREWVLIGAAIACWAFADGLFLSLEATGAYAEGSLVDPLWLIAATLLLAAAWVNPHSGQYRKHGEYTSLAIPSVYAVIAVGLLIYDLADPLSTAATMFVVLAVGLSAIRLVVAYRENEGLLATVRRQAATDSLTGLFNRRQLVVDVERALDPARSGGARFVFALFDLDGFKGYNDNFGHSSGDELLSRLGEKLQRAMEPHGKAYRRGGDEFCLLAEADPRDADEIAAAAESALRERGEGFDVDCSYGLVILPDEAQDASAAMQLADERMYQHKSSRRATPERQASDVLLSAMKEREPELTGHLCNVAALVRQMGLELEIDGEELDELVRAAELHDIGKMAIPDVVLHKPGSHNQGERDWMQQHTVVGERILNSAPAMSPVARLVRSSHERWDGNGYPDGLAGEEIPLGSRVIFICDAYDAMRSDRPYRRAIGEAEALEELRANAGTQFDPYLVDLFLWLRLRPDQLASSLGSQGATAATSRASSSARDGATEYLPVSTEK